MSNDSEYWQQRAEAAEAALAAARAQAERDAAVIEAADAYRTAEQDGTPRLWKGKDLHDLAMALDDALAARKEPIPPVVENEPERDWTGRPCPACAGTGQSANQFFDETACPACGGTGDEYAARKEPGHGS